MMMKNWTCKTEFPLKHSASASLAGNLPWDPTKDESIHHDTPLDTVYNSVYTVPPGWW